MAAKTIANLRTAGLAPASTDSASFPGEIILEFELDGGKLAVASGDTVDFFEIPAFAGFIVQAAAVTVVTPGTASGTLAIQVGGADVTGLTAWATDAAAGTQLVKRATAANSVINTGTASFVRVSQGGAALGTGRLRVRVFGLMLAAPSAQA
jgi:hypothetical protein